MFTVDTTPNPNPGLPLLIYSFRLISLDKHEEKSNAEMTYEEKFNEDMPYQGNFNYNNHYIDY